VSTVRRHLPRSLAGRVTLAAVAAVVMAKYARKQLAPARTHEDQPVPAVTY